MLPSELIEWSEIERLKRVDETQKSWLEHVRQMGEVKLAMMNVGVDHINKLLAMSRQFACQGGGLSSQTYGAPYPGSNVTIVTKEEKQDKSGGLLKALGLAALMGTGVGALGVGGYLAADKLLDGKAAPAATAPVKPINLEIKWRNDPDKGMQFDEVQSK